MQGNIQINQHDHEHEQHHDAAGVQDYLHDEQKLGVQLQEDAGGGQQRGDQEDRALHDVAARHHQDRGEHGKCGEKVEYDLIEHGTF